jgi:hypothetical protein
MKLDIQYWREERKRTSEMEVALAPLINGLTAGTSDQQPRLTARSHRDWKRSVEAIASLM